MNKLSLLTLRDAGLLPGNKRNFFQIQDKDGIQPIPIYVSIARMITSEIVPSQPTGFETTHGTHSNGRLLDSPFSQFSLVVRVLRPECAILSMCMHAQSCKKILLRLLLPSFQKSPIAVVALCYGCGSLCKIKNALCFCLGSLAKLKTQFYIFTIEVPLTGGKLLCPFKIKVQGLKSPLLNMTYSELKRLFIKHESVNHDIIFDK